jgi:hypothetical protein
MSREKYEGLVRAMCEALHVSDSATVLQRGAMEVSGFEVLVAHYSNDEVAMYLNFNFGILGGGKTLHGYFTMLQSNISLYAQDQAQLGVNPDTGGVLLIVRVPMTDEVDGPWLADTFAHYSEHGAYWRQTLHTVHDEEHAGPPQSHFIWMRA